MKSTLPIGIIRISLLVFLLSSCDISGEQNPPLYMAVGMAGRAWSSPDGENWTDVSPGGSHLHGITYGNGFFVAVGKGGRAWRTVDGTNWTDTSPGGDDLYDVAYGNETR